MTDLLLRLFVKHASDTSDPAVRAGAETLQVAESSMTLIAMINLLLNTKFLQSQDTTDTQQDLLLQAILPVTTIERVSDRTIKL